LYRDQAAVTTASSGSSSESSTHGFSWHQPAVSTAGNGSDSSAGGAGMVVYQLLTNGSVAAAADGSSSTAAGTQPSVPVYYGIDAYGQLVPTTKSSTAAATVAPSVSANETRLQQEVIRLRAALDEKTREAESLRSQLVELCASIERHQSRGGGEQTIKTEKTSSSNSPANDVSDTPPVTAADSE